ncbi:uncharacterized protein LOC115884415 isoform X2 [Sitophilus oryzae]|uniref:Uncharacterized protein LOC115884415 isoform X2 n=1 Tax=Sitophilus oryzae TaxID=7048 RepID=A0A6J2Y5A9_SITOR|nr:uncharacterized protein LOC115884415 isoform X2 [Sitophilus oryzae]
MITSKVSILCTKDRYVLFLWKFFTSIIYNSVKVTGHRNNFTGTWDMPKKITREVANQLNGMANKKAYFERCAQLAATPPSTKYQAIKKSETDQQSRDKESEKRLSEDTISLPTDTEPVIEKIICPIHDF